MQKKDLLIVCQYFYPDHVSTGRLPTELAEDLAAQGMTVDVLCGFPSYMVFDGKETATPQKEVYKGINIRRIAIPRLNKNSRIGRLFNYFAFAVGVLLRFLQFRKYDKVLLITNPPLLPYFGYLSKKIFHNKFIFLIYDLYPDIALALGAVNEGSLLVRAMNYVNERAFMSADAIIALGDDMKQYLIKNKKIPHKDYIHVIPNWMDSTNITVKEKVNTFSLAEGLADKFVILYSGNIGLFQELEMLVECARLLQDYDDIVFIFVGEGGKKKKLINLVSEYKLQNVKFYGFQPDNIYNDVLASADCFVVTLEKAAEGLGVPSKTYTYLAAGRPLIGILSENTDIGKMLTYEKIGFQIDHDNIQLLAERILYLYKNQQVRLEMGRNARDLQESRYDRKTVTDQYYKLIGSV